MRIKTDIEFDIICAECGFSLDADYDPFLDRLLIQPCSYCEEKQKRETQEANDDQE